MNEIKVKDVMTHLVVTCRPQDTLQQAARKLLNNRISGAPVVEHGRLVGVVSEADLVTAYAPSVHRGARLIGSDPLMFLLRGTEPLECHWTVGDIMTTEVLTVSPEATVWQAASLIDRHGVRRLPVVDADGYVVGVLARADLVRAMARGDDEAASDVRRALSVLGEESFSSLLVTALDGVVTIEGTADRRSTSTLASRIAAQVPGVLEVNNNLDWERDDSEVKPVRNLGDANEVGRDPWAVGPLVKGGTR